MADKDNIGRQMGNVPLTPKNTPEPAKLDTPTNRFDSLFPNVTFKAITNNRVFEKDNMKSVRLASVTLETNVPGAVCHGTIRAVQNPGETEASPTFSFISSPYTRETSITADPNVPGAVADAEAFKESILDRYLAWRANGGQSSIAVAAKKRSIGLTL